MERYPVAASAATGTATPQHLATCLDLSFLTASHDNSLYVMAFLTHLDDIITCLDVS